MTRKTGPEPAAAAPSGLTGPARQMHQAVLAAFASTGLPPARSELERLARSLGASPDAVLAELAGTDAIAFNSGGEIRAAYPFSPVAHADPGDLGGRPGRLRDVRDRRARHVRHARPPGHDHRGRAGHRPDHHRPRRRQARRTGTRGPPWCSPARRAMPAAQSAECSCGYINFFASRRAARAWARRHPEVTGRLLTQQGVLGIGIAAFGSLLRAVPPRGAPAAATPE